MDACYLTKIKHPKGDVEMRVSWPISAVCKGNAAGGAVRTNRQEPTSFEMGEGAEKAY